MVVIATTTITTPQNHLKWRVPTDHIVRIRLPIIANTMAPNNSNITSGCAVAITYQSIVTDGLTQDEAALALSASNHIGFALDTKGPYMVVVATPTTSQDHYLADSTGQRSVQLSSSTRGHGQHMTTSRGEEKRPSRGQYIW